MSEPYYQDERVTLHHGDCLEVLAALPDASVDSVVCDPPYGLSNTDPQHVADTIVRWVNGDREYLPPVKGGFMGQEWDSFVPPVAVWDECLRVLKPGGHLLAFAGPRTMDLMGLGIRLAGFDIRDSIAWLYGSGFPKSLDVSKAIDKAAGAEREVLGPGAFASRRPASRRVSDGGSPEGEAALHYGDGHDVTAPATPDAERWQGWGTALKPAFEPVVVARKPLTGTVAANVLQHGTGALNIDATRVGEGGQLKWAKPRDMGYHGGTDSGPVEATTNPAGRWPTNAALDDSQAEVLDQQSGDAPPSARTAKRDYAIDRSVYSAIKDTPEGASWGYEDRGGASRFFYTAKADSNERPRINGVAHPTVKPLDLMRWLVRLVTPPGGTVLEPFAGSGTTVEACIAEGFRCIAIEREADYLPLITQRIHRRLDPLEAVRQAGGDLGLFDFGEPA